MKKPRTYEDIISAESNHWGTERVEKMPETLEEFRQVWDEIAAEFRPRPGGRGGSIYTNHQGILAIKTALEEIDQKPYPEFDGTTSELDDAVRLVAYFEKEAGVWGGEAGEKLKMLAGLYEKASVDALTNGNRAVTAIDTTSPDEKAGSPTLRYDKEKRRHEAFHIWEYSVNPNLPGLLDETTIKADIDYAMLEAVFADYYKGENTPHDIFSEAAAGVVSGAYWKAGFESKERALGFIDRFLTSVAKQYGINSLDKLHLLHPDIKEIINDIRAREITAPGRDVRSVQEGMEAGAGTDEETPRNGRTLRASNDRGGWFGGDGERQRRTDPGSEAGRERIIGHSEQPGLNLHTYLSTDDNTIQTLQGRSKPTPELVAALQKIANIEAIDLSGTRSWKELAGEAGDIAREAITRAGGAESVQDKEVVAALEKIAGIETGERNGRQLSWKDRASIAIEIARETIEKTQSPALAISAAGNALETGQNTYHSLQREPSHDQGMDW